MSMQQSPFRVFLSYAQEDEPWLKKLEAPLNVLTRQGIIAPWHTRKILAGSDRGKERDYHLETASIILLLISADFLASDYCYGQEMKRARERHEANDARVIPLLVRPADYQDTPFAHLRPLPADGRLIAMWEREDAAYVYIVSGIRHVIEQLPLLSASAPRATRPRRGNVPSPRNPVFTGREDLLGRLAEILKLGGAVALSQPLVQKKE